MEQNRLDAVWQRVMAPPAQACTGEPDVLLQESAALAAVYRWAAARFTGRKQALARQLLENEQATAACLRGIGILSGEPLEGVKLWEPGKKPGKGLLESCYHRTCRCRTEYAARSLDSQFGEVYRSLAQRAADQCLLLTQLLGTE